MIEGAVVIAVLASAIRLATPLMLAALGGVFAERSGVTNIGLEGIMIIGAFFAVLFTHITGNPWMGVLAAIAFGMLTSSLLGVLAINLRGNQVIAGVAINLLALSLSAFLLELIWKRSGATPSVPQALTTNPDFLKFLEKIPVVGDMFSRFTPFIYMAFILVGVSYYVLFKTPIGLRIRAVGEHPRAADTVGIDVYKIRWMCVLISGAFAGLAGASLSIGTISLFREGMVAGQGFIALAAMIFGKWHPVGAMLACLFFGLASAIQILAQSIGINIAAEILLMVPYIATIIALVGVVGKATAPAADGLPYEKGEK
jgi:simple sugar transport system permease protein